MNMQHNVILKKSRLLINFSKTRDEVSGGRVCTIWSLTLCQFLSFCSVIFEESLLVGYDTASLGSWFVTLLVGYGTVIGQLICDFACWI
jgi:hypothetical protein